MTLPSLSTILVNIHHKLLIILPHMHGIVPGLPKKHVYIFLLLLSYQARPYLVYSIGVLSGHSISVEFPSNPLSSEKKECCPLPYLKSLMAFHCIWIKSIIPLVLYKDIYTLTLATHGLSFRSLNIPSSSPKSQHFAYVIPSHPLLQ